MINLIELHTWKKRPEIMLDLLQQGIQCSDRDIRRWAEEQNEKWCSGESEYYIAHSNQGYKQTTDRNEIIESALDLKKKALNMFKKYWAVEKRINAEHEQEIYLSLFEEIKKELEQ